MESDPLFHAPEPTTVNIKLFDPRYDASKRGGNLLLKFQAPYSIHDNNAMNGDMVFNASLKVKAKFMQTK